MYKDMPGPSNAIHQQFDKLEEKKNALMQKISSLSDASYRQQPSPESWSVAQAANHLYMSEQLSMAYIRKKLSYPDTIPPYSIRSWLGVWSIQFVFWSPYKRKAPRMINMWEDQPILSQEDLAVKWSQQRKDLITLIDQHQEAFGTHLVYRHPFAGRMTMRQMLIFFNDHMALHTRQIDRIISKVS